jgi:hypothetical protein
MAEVARLFDHIVSVGEQDRRDRDVGLRRFEIINRRNGISVGVHEMDRKANAVARRPNKRLFSVGRLIAIAFNAS